MRTRALLLGTVLMAACATGPGGPQVDSRGVVVVGSDASDGRLGAVREAVDFWNGEFARLDLQPPFGAVRFVPMDFSEELLASYSQAVLEGGRRPRLPDRVLELPGQFVIVLSDSPIISFAASLGRGDRWLVGIRTDQVPPLSLPNVPRNLVAHELGHTLGLGHNSDPTKLMCGRPALCRPGEFRSDESRFFELTPEELRRLSGIHGLIAHD
ncbi:hypothetical protein ACFL0I_00100 [Gemmatimonadota bacterium]